MIPLRSMVPRSRPAVVTTLLILANVLAFLFELSLGPTLPRFVAAFGLRPISTLRHLIALDGTGAVLPVFTSMFLHGGWAHLLGNMLFLWVFGSTVESRLGHARYAALYFLSGMAAATAQVAAAPLSSAPMIGASGAIAGVLGAYLLLYPRAKVLSLVPLFFFVFLWEVPAVLLLVMWIVTQFVSGVASLETGQALYGGVAYWAHVGGFFAGLALAALLEPRDFYPRYPRYPSADYRWAAR